MKDLKPVPVTPGILQVLVLVVILYGLAGAVLELWNLNIIPGRLMPGIWVSLGMITLWTGFLWLDRGAAGVLKQRLFTAGTVLIVALLAAYSILDRSSTPARLASLAFNWSLAGFGAALLLRVRRGRGDEERIS